MQSYDFIFNFCTIQLVVHCYTTIQTGSRQNKPEIQGENNLHLQMLKYENHKLAIGFVAFCVHFFFRHFKMLIVLFLDSLILFMKIISYRYVKF